MWRQKEENGLWTGVISLEVLKISVGVICYRIRSHGSWGLGLFCCLQARSHFIILTSSGSVTSLPRPPVAFCSSDLLLVAPNAFSPLWRITFILYLPCSEEWCCSTCSVSHMHIQIAGSSCYHSALIRFFYYSRSLLSRTTRLVPKTKVRCCVTCFSGTSRM